MKVSNKKCIRRLALRRMKSSRSANIIAVLAIALTAVLFTSLITIVMSALYGYEQSNFRKVGGYSHGCFRSLTDEQFNELKFDPLIKEYSDRIIVGMPSEASFDMAYTEISCCDENAAKWMYLIPAEGRLPAENTNEAATDTRVLSLLGVTPEIGAEFTLNFEVNGIETSGTFTLCGWWEFDSASSTSHVLIPKSRTEEIYSELETEGYEGITKTHTMDVMLKSSAHIFEDMMQILANHGYQSESRSNGDNFISVSINMGYIEAGLAENMDAENIIALTAMILLIGFTGYLIIYNVFRISVSNDIRHYGLLKTIGTTGRQLRRMIFIQAMTLSAAGIPIGLLIGYGIGAVLTPIILSELNDIQRDALSISPVIFIGAAVFSLVTVMISCLRPGMIAAKVSPIEALRYNESVSSKTVRRKKKAASIPRMAAANLGRSKSKTVTTIFSLSLAVILLNLSFAFANGFDINEYVKESAVTDFVVSDEGYFHFQADEHEHITAETVDIINAQGGISESGITYAKVNTAYEYVPEDYFRNAAGMVNDPETVDYWTENRRNEKGLIENTVQLYGMSDFCLDELDVLEGDINGLRSGENCIAAVYDTDETGAAVPDSSWAKTGDVITIRYVDEMEYFDPLTGDIIDDPSSLSDTELYDMRPIKYRDVEYTVTAIVSVPYSLSYRYKTVPGDEFVLGSETFLRDSRTDSILYYAFNMENDASIDSMEQFLADCTEKTGSSTAYESRQTFTEEFSSFTNMMTICGVSLSVIVGIVGILNFANAILSGIFARRRELAVLRSIGMTGRQQNEMLIVEGLYYTIGSILLSAVLTAVLIPIISAADGGIMSLFHFSISPIPMLITLVFFIILGTVIPVLTFKACSKQTVVERLTVDS
ncbi:MAG: FtsX-like permease family protein [Oscillospiraceae bacterium]